MIPNKNTTLTFLSIGFGSAFVYIFYSKYLRREAKKE